MVATFRSNGYQPHAMIIESDNALLEKKKKKKESIECCVQRMARVRKSQEAGVLARSKLSRKSRGKQ